jgi:hypothetical protein
MIFSVKPITISSKSFSFFLLDQFSFTEEGVDLS